MAGKPEPIDPAAKQYAIDEIGKGRSVRDVARELVELGYKVSHMKVFRWATAAAVQPHGRRGPRPGQPPGPLKPGKRRGRPRKDAPRCAHCGQRLPAAAGGPSA